MKIKLSEIKNTEPIREHGDIKALIESIKKEGLLQPLVINQDNELICGRRRLEAINHLGWKEVPIYKIKTDDDVDKLSKILAENIMRLNFSWQEEIKVKEELDQLMRAKYGSAKKGERTDLTCSDSEQVWTIKKTADLLNESKALISEDIQLAQALKEYPELAKASTKSMAKMELKKIKKKEKIKTLISPEGLYNVIVIDPPWNYGTKYDDKSRRVGSPYPELSFEELTKIKLPSANDCVLWLWTTHKFIWDAKKLMDIWGFEYKLILVWDKEKLGMGSWLRCQTEFCLIGIKGHPVWNLTNERDLIREARKEHSRKPNCFYDMVEKITTGRKIDWFGRYKRDGWDIYGD